MRLHSFEHVMFENLAYIETWSPAKKFEISRTRFYANDPLPEIEDFDWLIVMGGPMNIYEESKFPWLREEKKLIEQAIKAKKTVLGICLGAQLIADVLGGKVTKNKHKEIGWFPVKLTPEAENSIFFMKGDDKKGQPLKFGTVPESFTAFHWHGDTFQIPKGAIHLAESKACRNQAFEYHNRVIGLQFHLESTAESIERLITNCADEIVDGEYIQKPETMRSMKGSLSEIKKWMEFLLERLTFCLSGKF